MTPKLLVVDLFCGAGGTTTGFAMAAQGAAQVVACVNHDPLAIMSHAANHPDTLHFTEDIRTLELSPLLAHVRAQQAQHPGAKLLLWASLECTNFSNAKGGLPRDADSRTLAWELYRYIDALRPDAIAIENVREFMAWGPLTPQGKPESRTAGRDYIGWVKAIQSRGYRYDWRLLCAADFGACTTRTRYFGLFAGAGFPLVFPQRTHAPAHKCEAEGLQPWRPVREVLDLHLLGRDIFDRPKPLVENSLRRILAGLRKFCPEPFLVQEYSGDPEQKSYPASSPARTLTTSANQTIVQVQFTLTQQYTNEGRTVDEPCPTITGQQKMHVATAFMVGHYGGGAVYRGIDQPAASVKTENVTQCISFLTAYHGTGDQGRSVDEPAATVTTADRLQAVQFIMNPQYGNQGSSVDAPAPTLIAQMAKKPLSIATAMAGMEPPEDLPGDSEMTAQLKAFMRERGIARVFARMITVNEAKRIQGFPQDYILHGSQRHRLKFVGNSVETHVVKAWAERMIEML